MRAAILVVSDGVSAGTRMDDSGPALESFLTEAGFVVVATHVVPDVRSQIQDAIRRLAGLARLVLTTGGTGFGPRDVTPEATKAVIEREAPGLVHLMVGKGIEQTPYAALSRGTVGTIGSTLVVNLPGSPRGATENLRAVLGLLPHALELLAGNTEH